MANDDKYGPRSAADAARLVGAAPLAWVVSGEGDRFRATLLPLRAASAGDGRVTHLTGHFARRNDHHHLLADDPRAAVLFLGPHAYVSPSWMRDRTQAPTWNYASVQFLVEFAFIDDPVRLRAHFEDLVDAMEAGGQRPWRVEETAHRYEALARHVTPFEARVVEVREKYKLGQDERDDVYADIVTGLDAAGHDTLRAWMDDFNPGRGSAR